MELAFTKMHGLGNDMIVVDSIESGWVPSEDQARRLCHRRLGVGADQMLILLRSDRADFRMRVFNQDGSEVEMCGNGIRCLARFIHDRGLSTKDPLEIETLAGIIKPESIGELVRVDMGEPVFEAARVPVKAEGKIRDRLIEIDGASFKFSAVSMGNPHCVIRVDDAEAVPLERFGPPLEHHPLFPKRTNVEFVQIIDRKKIKVRVWERGAGATLACGTGATAAAVIMIDQGLTDPELTVTLPGGDLHIAWSPGAHAFMTGPAVEVFTGVARL